MIHHGENLPTKNTKQNQKLADDLDEKCLAEMLFYMEQMRRLIRKYDKVVKKYYVQYLSGYDVIEFKESIQVYFSNVSIKPFLKHNSYGICYKIRKLQNE